MDFLALLVSSMVTHCLAERRWRRPVSTRGSAGTLFLVASAGASLGS